MPRRCHCHIPNTPPSTQVELHCQDLHVTNDQLREIMKGFLSDINMGLKRDTHSKAILKCFITYVQDLPDGSESGKALALDLGGTNFRVLLIEFKEVAHQTSKIYTVPKELMVGSSKALFDHIAECLANFIKENKLQDELLPLGFTFSFPVSQKSLARGLLERWTKGFDCKDAVGKDVVKMLDEAIARRNDIKVLVTAILNDTTGTLMSCAYNDPFCRIGLIIGTGTNACYVEKQTNAELFDDKDRGSGMVIINLEWGAFGDDGKLDFLRTVYDKEVDKNSINPGKQIFEKMISGMYLGELVRLCLVSMAKKGIIFSGSVSEQLLTPDSFETKFVSEIESDPEGSYTKCRRIISDLRIKNPTDDDLKNVRYVCERFSRRSAFLVSAGLAVLINKMNEPRITIAIDGTLYRLHPFLHYLMLATIKSLITCNTRYKLMLSEDGSGRGAALVAAVAAKYNKSK